MGNCGSGIDECDKNRSKPIVISNKPPTKTSAPSSQIKETKPEPKVELSNIENMHNFEDFPLLDGEYYFGEGIRKVKAYKCGLPYDKLEQKRANFWDSKKTDRQIWRCLKECCDVEEYETAIPLLDASELDCVDGNMQKVKDRTTQKLFCLPNWVVASPTTIIDFSDKAEKSIAEKETKIKIYMNDKIFNVSTKMMGNELKIGYLKACGMSSNEYSIRIFYRGKEVKDNHLLCYHEISNESKLMISINKKENEQ